MSLGRGHGFVVNKVESKESLQYYSTCLLYTGLYPHLISSYCPTFVLGILCGNPRP